MEPIIRNHLKFDNFLLAGSFLFLTSRLLLILTFIQVYSAKMFSTQSTPSDLQKHKNRIANKKFHTNQTIQCAQYFMIAIAISTSYTSSVCFRSRNGRGARRPTARPPDRQKNCVRRPKKICALNIRTVRNNFYFYKTFVDRRNSLL